MVWHWVVLSVFIGVIALALGKVLLLHDLLIILWWVVTVLDWTSRLLVHHHLLLLKHVLILSLIMRCLILNLFWSLIFCRPTNKLLACRDSSHIVIINAIFPFNYIIHMRCIAWAISLLHFSHRFIVVVPLKQLLYAWSF